VGLSFPSDKSWGETIELSFRDGKRRVPSYLANLMSDLDTVLYTFDDAIEVANRRLERDFVGNFQQNVVSEHLKRFGGS
jgi:hypothetical protein